MGYLGPQRAGGELALKLHAVIKARARDRSVSAQTETGKMDKSGHDMAKMSSSDLMKGTDAMHKHSKRIDSKKMDKEVGRAWLPRFSVQFESKARATKSLA